MKFKKWFVFLAAAASPLFLMGSKDSECSGSTTAQKEMAQLESQQDRLQREIPMPTLETSLERANIARRLQWLNRKGVVTYVRLMTDDVVVAEYAVDGKVSSLNSYMSTMEQVKSFGGTSNYQVITLEAPDSDGSYGKNPDGIFFFTTEGEYVEWNGHYLCKSTPFRKAGEPAPVEAVEGPRT